ncbi:hypothetical protein L2E82_15418 [Cichorium intybus]|uniref:Uncharacterized protein n=1 Tax=Cichorium intybus TaxID=13427 RepID=A0ACB9F361_CICIN|nr:hypothetical protein L2E82_15418 [Cichorium intybus]
MMGMMYFRIQLIYLFVFVLTEYMIYRLCCIVLYLTSPSDRRSAPDFYNSGFSTTFQSTNSKQSNGHILQLNGSYMDRLKEEKIQRFEEFVDRRLKPDLVRAIAERDKVFEQQKVFSDLRKNLENLEKNSVTSLRSMVNLGSEVYAQADVPDTRHIFVDVGLGFHVELTWSEALKIIPAREQKFARQIEEYTRLIAQIKAQIKMVSQGIRELLQLPESE